MGQRAHVSRLLLGALQVLINFVLWYEHMHCRYLHFEDSDDIDLAESDPASKTRTLRELLQDILPENVQPP